MSSQSQTQLELLKSLERLWNLENQLVIDLPTLVSITQSQILVKFLRRQQKQALANRKRLEQICTFYNHVPCISGEQKLSLGIHDARSFNGILSDYGISQTMIVNLMQDMEEVKTQQYSAFINYLQQIEMEKIASIILENLKDSVNFNQTLESMWQIIQKNALTPVVVNAS